MEEDGGGRWLKSAGGRLATMSGALRAGAGAGRPERAGECRDRGSGTGTARGEIALGEGILD